MEDRHSAARGSEAFPRRYRLGENRNYRYVYRRGKSTPSRNVTLVYMKARDLKIGFSVSGKVGNAVTRNRIRRWMREDVRRLRARGVSTPVLLLTARSEVPDRVEGLDAGADDYLPKPFAMAELLARVRALVRRRERLVPEVISFAGLSLDLSAYTLSCKGRSARLGNREFQMMEMLMEAPRRIISTAQFMERVWGWDADVDVSIVWVYVSNLRKKIAQLGADVEIRATRGVGYSLEAKA